MINVSTENPYNVGTDARQVFIICCEDNFLTRNRYHRRRNGKQNYRS